MELLTFVIAILMVIQCALTLRIARDVTFLRLAVLETADVFGKPQTAAQLLGQQWFGSGIADLLVDPALESVSREDVMPTALSEPQVSTWHGPGAYTVLAFRDGSMRVIDHKATVEIETEKEFGRFFETERFKHRHAQIFHREHDDHMSERGQWIAEWGRTVPKKA